MFDLLREETWWLNEEGSVEEQWSRQTTLMEKPMDDYLCSSRRA